jgi:16S rRNA (guanine527-N7)-methyltransferase
MSVFPEPLLARLQSGALAFGIDLGSSRLELCRRYMELLLEWNQRFNLTAIEAPESVIDKHFLDSLSSALALDFSGVRRLVDVGTGAGFPGLVLKIAYPHLELLLLDAVEKRLRFLQRVVDELRLPEVRMLHARAEDAGRDPAYREQFDAAISRAVARLNTLAEYCLPLVRVGGTFLAQKGPQMTEELDEAREALRILGGGEPTVHSHRLPRSEIERSLVLVPKIRATPRTYPRQAGTPRKHPL